MFIFANVQLETKINKTNKYKLGVVAGGIEWKYA